MSVSGVEGSWPQPGRTQRLWTRSSVRPSVMPDEKTWLTVSVLIHPKCDRPVRFFHTNVTLSRIDSMKLSMQCSGADLKATWGWEVWRDWLRKLQTSAQYVCTLLLYYTVLTAVSDLINVLKASPKLCGKPLQKSCNHVCEGSGANTFGKKAYI